MDDDFFLPMLIFSHYSSSLMLSSRDSCMPQTTLETVALDTPNNTAVFVTDAPAKRAPTICPLSKSD
jgi:hypothetical protein